VKSQGVILYTVVLNTLVFSSMVGYLVGGIYCEEGMSPCFLKIGNSCNCFSKWCLAGLFLPQYCTVLIMVCRKTCFTITAYWYICTCNMLYSLSYVREQCDDGLWVSLKFFPLTSPFPSQQQDSYSRSWSLNVVAMMMEAARTAAMLVLLLQSI